MESYRLGSRNAKRAEASKQAATMRKTRRRSFHTLRAFGTKSIPKARSVWNERRLVFRIVAACLLASALLAFLLPRRYDSITKLMPPDNQSTSGVAIMAALASKGSLSTGLGSVAG